MEYYNVNYSIYSLLNKAIDNIELISVDMEYYKKTTPYPRIEVSNFVITEDILKTNESVVTAHILKEYLPNKINFTKLFRDSRVLLIDILIKDIGGIRGGKYI